LRAEIEELRNRNAELEEENRKLEGEIETMTYINNEFAKESEEYKRLNERLTKRLDEAEELGSDEDRPNPPKRRRVQPDRRAKDKMASDDESDSKDARAEMKILMKTIPANLELRVDEVFSSSTNKRILNSLVPELIKSMSPRFHPTRKQLHEWLGALHRHQRGRYRKRETGKLDADNRRLHANSRLSEVRFFF
jgi:DNA repair exonuclease SbcCD ATPase subunit